MVVFEVSEDAFAMGIAHTLRAVYRIKRSGGVNDVNELAKKRVDVNIVYPPMICFCQDISEFRILLQIHNIIHL
jgi:hypothetical protein